MTTYYYHKDRYGKELCHEVESIDEDCKERLELMGDDAACCVSHVWKDDVFGYKSLEEYEREEVNSIKISFSMGLDGSVNYNDDNSDAEFNAMKEFLDNGGSYPFCVVRHRDGSYEAMNESDVDWQELADEYEDFGHWRIQPGYYDSDEMTPEQARKREMYALAEELEGNRENEESEEE